MYTFTYVFLKQQLGLPPLAGSYAHRACVMAGAEADGWIGLSPNSFRHIAARLEGDHGE